MATGYLPFLVVKSLGALPFLGALANVPGFFSGNFSA